MDMFPTMHTKDIATGDYDAIVIGHSQFERVPLSPERQKAIVERQIDDITLALADARSEDSRSFTVKQMEKTKKTLEAKLQKLNDQTRKDAYFHIQTCDDGFNYTLYNKDFTERDGGILETDGDKSVQEAMTELLAEFGCDAAEGKVMDAAELREQADMVAEQQAEVLKEKLAAERPAPEETLSFYVAECLEFTFAGEFHDHLTMEEALEVYDKIPSERMNADKCIGFCIEEDGGFVGMYELVVNDKVQRENINSINYFRDDKLVQQAISDMEKLMAARQQSKEQERGSTKKSVLDALRSLKAKKQEQPAQEQDKPKKAKKKGMEL